MIKLTLPDKPAALAANEESLTNEFKADHNKSVWRKDYIVNPLLEMTHNKCAYSEIKLQEESKYMEVEHFKHKDAYPDDVVKWGNLLPTCKTCNVTKGKWDVVENPIVNPIEDDPKDFLFVKCFRFYPKDNNKGRNTIDAVGLNDQDNFVIPRARIAFDYADRLEAEYLSLRDADTDRKRHIRINRIKSILKKCYPTEEYSAVISSFILYDWPKFHDMVDYLKDSDLWDNDFEEIITRITTISLPEN